MYEYILIIITLNTNLKHSYNLHAIHYTFMRVKRNKWFTMER